MNDARRFVLVVTCLVLSIFGLSLLKLHAPLEPAALAETPSNQPEEPHRSPVDLVLSQSGDWLLTANEISGALGFKSDAPKAPAAATDSAAA